jgi:hypothetical protein
VKVIPESTLPTHWDPWPEALPDVLCWYCCHTFSTRPIPLPTSYNEKTNVFKVRGVFCSWACMRSYESSTGNRNTSRSHPTDLFYKRITGKFPRGDDFSKAPPRAFLKAFGGFMNIDDFRKSHAESNWVEMPPRLITQEQVFHERRVGEQTRNNSKVILSEMDLQESVDLLSTSNATRGESLRLRRPKPAKKASNILEIALGLNKKS